MLFLKKTSAAVAAALIVSLAAMAQSVSIQREGTAYKVSGWAAPKSPPAQGWASVFAIYAGAGNVPALLGSYSVESGLLVFHPQYPAAPGVQYRAVFHQPTGGPAIEKIFDGPVRSTIHSARVEHVYPSGDVLPANQLRLYIYFSAPMSRGEAAQRISVREENGRVLKDIFLPGEELWDPHFQRLTMTFDPGRIKRGLTSNMGMGSPVTEGKRYKLVIDGGWLDANGVAMAEGFTKSFRGGPSDRVPPDPKQWRVTAPHNGTLEALTVDFPDPMSYPLLQRMMRVLIGNTPVPGTIGIERHETQWRFTPRDPWKAGTYQLNIDTAIEDLAGNHIGQPFDIDVFDKVTEHLTATSISLPFTVH